MRSIPARLRSRTDGPRTRLDGSAVALAEVHQSDITISVERVNTHTSTSVGRMEDADTKLVALQDMFPDKDMDSVRTHASTPAPS